MAQSDGPGRTKRPRRQKSVTISAAVINVVGAVLAAIILVVGTAMTTYYFQVQSEKRVVSATATAEARLVLQRVTQTAEAKPPTWAFEGLENGAKVPQEVSLRVKYPAKVSGDVLVIQQQHKNGKYFPMPVALDTQTCTVTLALTGGRPFSGKIGEANQKGERFTLHLVVADTMASDTLTETLQRWCNDESYPGMSELPHGVEIKHSVEVQRHSGP